MEVLKISLRVGIAFLIIIMGICIIFSIVYSPEYVYRCLVFGIINGNVEDHSHTRPIRANPMPFAFAQGSKEESEQVTNRFEEIFGTNDLDKYLASTGTKAFLVIQNDKILYEHYSNGADRNSKLLAFSVTKSIVSALIGIAQSEGTIQSIEDPITDYLPELANRDPRYRNITLRHLLMMSSGIRFDNYFFFTSDSALSGAYPDLRYAALNFPLITDDPGKHFWYNDYNPQLLGLVLEKVTGMSVSAYLESRIWQPIGMETDGFWDLDSHQPGFELMQGGLNASAIDFAKFGRLYLKKGMWEGRRIIPETWVDESTQEDTSVNGNYYPKNYWIDFSKGIYYKYMWWGLRRDNQPACYYAMGRNGQMIYLAPSNNLIVIRLGERGVGEETWYRAAYQFARDDE